MHNNIRNDLLQSLQYHIRETNADFTNIDINFDTSMEDINKVGFSLFTLEKNTKKQYHSAIDCRIKDYLLKPQPLKELNQLEIIQDIVNYINQNLGV